VPAHLSARLCASLKTNGDRNSFLLDIPAGHLKGTKAATVFGEPRTAGPASRKGFRLVDLSKTAGAEAKAEA
jgi:hypothetical protein